MIRVLDSHALMIFLEKQAGYEKLQRLFLGAVEKDEHLFMTSVNYGEIYEIVLQECGQNKADELEMTIKNLPIKIIDVDVMLSCEAAKIRAKKGMSLASSFSAALARTRKGELISGDKEFKNVQTEIKLNWIL